MIRTATAATDVLGLIESLGYDATQTARLVEAVEVVPHGYRFRAMAVPSLDALVGPEREPYARVRCHVEVPRPFSFMPTSSFFLLLLAAGRTLYPGADARTGCRNVARDACLRFAGSVYAQPILLSAEGKFGRFVEMQAKLPDFFQNFSIVDYEPVGPHHVRLHYSESLSAMAGDFVLPGFWQGMFQTFGVEGEITMNAFDAHTFDLELTW